MVTLGFIAVSQVNHIPLKISVMKKISDVRSKMVFHGVATELSFVVCSLGK